MKKKVPEANKEKKKKKQEKSKEADSLCEENKLHLQTQRYTDIRTDTLTNTHGQADKPHCIILYLLLLTPCTSPCPYVRPHRRP